MRRSHFPLFVKKWKVLKQQGLMINQRQPFFSVEQPHKTTNPAHQDDLQKAVAQKRARGRFGFVEHQRQLQVTQYTDYYKKRCIEDFVAADTACYFR